jgi:Transposase DDE domain/Insertion element 4 transposase N-terminal
MSKSTPFFAAFGPLLFGKPRLTEIEKLLRANEHGHSLSQYQQAFGEFVPKALLAPSADKVNSRQRLFPQLITFWAFLAQVLERGSSCRDALRRITAWLQFERPGSPLPSTETGGYCTARRRLPEATLKKIGAHMADQLERNLPSSELWLKRRVKIVDGTTASMLDTAENQEAWPQPRSQKPGCGFPVVKLVGFFSLGSGALLELAEGSLRQHELRLARQLWSRLDPGDVILADRGLCSYLDLSEIARLGADAVMRLHQKRKVDFRQGKRLGPDDQIVVWTKPSQRPAGYTPEAFAALPETLTLRMVRYRVKTPGFRTKEVVLITTLLDPIAYPASALAALYFRRWSVELHFREIKVLLGLDVLRCQTPEMIRKEIAMHRIAYNLVRLLMQRASLTHHVPLARISFKGTLDSLHHFADAIHALAGHPRRQATLLEELLRTIAKDLLPVRPCRTEPRAKKRRAKNYHLLTHPRRKMNVPGHRNRTAKIIPNVP